MKKIDEVTDLEGIEILQSISHKNIEEICCAWRHYAEPEVICDLVKRLMFNSCAIRTPHGHYLLTSTGGKLISESTPHTRGEVS